MRFVRTILVCCELCVQQCNHSPDRGGTQASWVLEVLLQSPVECYNVEHAIKESFAWIVRGGWSLCGLLMWSLGI